MEKITLKTIVNRNVETVWDAWTNPIHITKWNFANEEWCCPSAVVDLVPGGTYSCRMEAKDGSMGFDFGGTYRTVELHRKIESELGDGRVVKVVFSDLGDRTEVVETFDAEGTHPIEMQRSGWQAILDNFRKYAETL